MDAHHVNYFSDYKMHGHRTRPSAFLLHQSHAFGLCDLQDQRNFRLACGAGSLGSAPWTAVLVAQLKPPHTIRVPLMSGGQAALTRVDRRCRSTLSAGSPPDL